jgi:hypothetical protein
MAVESSTDRAEFFNSDEFGVEVTFGASTFDAIFDHEYVEAGHFAGEKPVAHCRESDISGVSLGSTLTIGGTSYVVREIQPDGTGLALLILEAA